MENELKAAQARIAEMQERFDSTAFRTSLIGRLEIENKQLRAELAALKAQGVVMPDVNAAAKALCNRHAMICGVDADDQWKEYSQDFIADAETVLANARLCAATVLEVNAHCTVIPEPYGWVAAGSFYTDRESAICAAEKTPCIDVYSRPQMNALENRSLQRQELAEELARQLNASCAEIRNMRNLYAAPVSEAKAQGVVLQELRSFEKWWCSTPILRESKRTIAEKAWLAARLNSAPVQQVSVPPFAQKVIRKMERFQECADDGQGADIGRNWFDLLTQLGLLNRVQRSPALWEMTQQGEDLLAAAPAAPAADAGMVDMYRHLQKVTPYRFKKIQDASITDGGDVMYFHKDRFDAALLADMAAHCAAKGVV